MKLEEKRLQIEERKVTVAERRVALDEKKFLFDSQHYQTVFDSQKNIINQLMDVIKNK